jgi:hypothetical protein
MDAPSLEQLLEWQEQGGCEATDGCWVEPDGCWVHGEPFVAAGSGPDRARPRPAAVRGANPESLPRTDAPPPANTQARREGL